MTSISVCTGMGDISSGDRYFDTTYRKEAVVCPGAALY